MTKYIKPGVVAEDTPEFISKRTRRITQLTQEISELKAVEQSNFIIGLIQERQDQLAKVQKIHDLSNTRRAKVRSDLIAKISYYNQKITDLADPNSEASLYAKKMSRTENAVFHVERDRETIIQTLSNWDRFYEEG